ncbi:MAG: hypothetical protein ACOCP3_03400 [Halodesulfurarchaeum sp.]
MPIRNDAAASDPSVIDRYTDGFGWHPHPEETMERASHAVVFDDRVWIVDPIDAPEIEEEIEQLGEVAGVVVLLDRHERDAAAFARRFDVPIYRPPFVDRNFDAPVKALGNELPGTDVDVFQTVEVPKWKEAALFDGETLVLADALGTAGYFAVGPERIGVHPLLRLTPPNGLDGLEPDRILVGHGAGIHDDASSALEQALSGARRRLPQSWLAMVRGLV